jgi:ABC-type phosphate/phosphonate transport system substrate-binding protein
MPSQKLRAVATSRMRRNCPGAISEGDTLEEARENLRDAIEQLLEANRQITASSKLGKKITRETIAVSLGRL